MLSEFSRQEIDAQLPSLNHQKPVLIQNKASLANSQNMESALEHLQGLPNPQTSYNEVFTEYSRDCEGPLQTVFWV